MAVTRYLAKLSVLSLFVLVTMASGDAQAQISAVLNQTTDSIGTLPFLTSLASYLLGLTLAVIGLFKFKDHVDNPQQTPLSEGVKRFLAGGMLLSIPWMAAAVIGNLFGDSHGDSTPTLSSRLAGGGGEAGALDTLAVNFITDFAGPMQVLLSAFTYIAAGIFLFMAITRLTKRMDDGPRGPGGLGTIATFFISGALFAFGDMIGVFSTSMFGDQQVLSAVNIDERLDIGDTARVETVIQAVMLFVMIVGVIAFIRGWFVLRAFADGQQGATVAQGLTFLFGGALAINLGELINAIQLTLDINGITFS